MRQAATRRLCGLLALTLIGALLGGCGAPSHQAVPRRGGTLRIALIGAPATIDPLQVKDASGTEVDELLYDGLVRVSPRLVPQADLARSWTVSPDGLTYTFQLNPKARWQDGQPVTPQDVAFSFAAYRNPLNGSAVQGMFADVRSVAAVGPHAVQVRLVRPDAPFLLEAATLPVLPAHLLARYAPGKALLSAPALGARAVGSGPFRLASSADGSYVLTANKDYFLGAPHLSSLTLTVERSPSAALLLLRRGKLDFAPVPPIDASAVATWPGVQLVRSFALAFAGIVWNVAQPPFSDPALRRALYFAVNRAQIVQAALYGDGAVANGPVPPASWAWDKSLSPRGYDPSKAVALLAAAGWHRSGAYLVNAQGAPLRLTILAPSGAQDRTVAIGLLARDLTAIGIDLHVAYEPFAQYAQNYVAGNFQAAFAVRGLSADPDLTPYFGSAAVNSTGMNPGGYQNPQVDAALRAERSAVTLQARALAFVQAQQAMQVDPPELFLYFPQTVDALSRRFQGFTANPATALYAPQRWSVRLSR